MPTPAKAKRSAPEAIFNFGFENVATMAKKLAQTSYVPPRQNLPSSLANLQFKQYSQIQYKTDRNIWRSDKLPFQLSFLHEGMQYDTPVKVNLVTSRSVQPVDFNADDFTYGDNKIPKQDLDGLQFSGFRVEVPIDGDTNNTYQNLVFQGASFLRAIGQGQRFGLSARGLGVDTGSPGGEEFPLFKEFWIARPSAKDETLIIYALLDSQSMTGAYRFVLHPGVSGVINVSARLYLRSRVEKLELAPLSSMFLFGPNQPSATADYRPSLHDSEGLSVHTAEGQWLWRPLVNPRVLTISSFPVTNPKGFGLMQRSIAFADYEDLTDRYDLRPSGWVHIKGNWGKGRIELVEIPTPDETNDNIAAYWVPDEQPKPQDALNFEYDLRFEHIDQTMPDSNLGHVAQTRYSVGMIKQANLVRRPDGTQEFIVDFAGQALQSLPATAPVEASVTPDPSVQLVNVRVVRNDAVGGYRLVMRFKRKPANDDSKLGPARIDAYLHTGNTTLTETWSYLLPAP